MDLIRYTKYEVENNPVFVISFFDGENIIFLRIFHSMEQQIFVIPVREIPFYLQIFEEFSKKNPISNK